MLVNLMLVSVLLIPGAGQQVQSQAAWPYATGPSNEFVIRNATDLLAASPYHPKKGSPSVGAEQKALAELTKSLKVKEIEWNAQMVVVIRQKKIHALGIEVGALEVRERNLTIRYRYWAPVAGRQDDPDDPSPVPTDAAIMLLMARFDGIVSFASQEHTLK